ncbi:MAG: hypothetical protein VX633_05520, partial [Verrucomicrobiota bacterium]|nr:hypothetical protein [Verrucomicrobiota bacterium]
RVDNYQLPDRRIVSGATMLLCLLNTNEDIRVGKGSLLDVEGRRWTVIDIRLSDDGQGWVDLETERARDVTLVKPGQLDSLFEEDCDDRDGSTDTSMGRLAIGLQRTEFPAKIWLTDGRILRAFSGEPSTFTPGLKA